MRPMARGAPCIHGGPFRLHQLSKMGQDVPGLAQALNALAADAPLVVYSTISGNTKVAAEAVADGARSVGADVTLKAACDAQPQDLVSCDAVALGSYDAFSPYTVGGEEHSYIPDFPVRLDDGHGREDPLNLIVEVTGERDKDKAEDRIM